MNKILTKDGVLLTILFIMSMAVIIFNSTSIVPSEAFMLLLGALVTAFIMKKEDEPAKEPEAKKVEMDLLESIEKLKKLQ